MKKHQQHPGLTFSQVMKAVSQALNSLFFSDDNRDFQRLKNFIGS
jgi:hypothetical protein